MGRKVQKFADVIQGWSLAKDRAEFGILLLWKIPTTAWTVETGLKFPIIDPLTYFDLINPKRIFLKNKIF